MENEKASFRFEIDNFSDKEAPIASKTFVSGGCEWFLYVYPKGDQSFDEHMYLYLCVANHKSLGTGWKREADYYFVLLNQSNKKLHCSSIQARSVFWDWIPGWGFRTAMPRSSFQDKGFLENDRLIIEVYIKNVEAVDRKGRYLSEKKKETVEFNDFQVLKETVEFNGFQVLVSQVPLMRKIFAEHPDIVKDFKQKNQVLKSAYMNVLLNLIEVLYKQNHSETELANAHNELCELMKVGFNLDWLMLKLEEVSSQRKKFQFQKLKERIMNLELKESNHDQEVSWIQKLEARVNNLELKESKHEEVCLERKNANDADGSRFQNLEESVKNLEQKESKREEIFLQRKKAYDAVGSQVQDLEERVKNLEWMELDLKLDCLKSKLEEFSLERKKTDAANGSQIQKLKERIKKFELMDLGSLKSKLEEVYLERKKAYVDVYRVQQLEENFKNLEMMVSNLKVELDKEMGNSSVDGFFMVDEIA